MIHASLLQALGFRRGVIRWRRMPTARIPCAIWLCLAGLALAGACEAGGDTPSTVAAAVGSGGDGGMATGGGGAAGQGGVIQVCETKCSDDLHAVVDCNDQVLAQCSDDQGCDLVTT